MNYAIEIKEVEASKFVGRVDGETEPQFIERMKKAKDHSLFTITVLRGWRGDKPKQLNLMSAYFKTADNEDRLRTFGKAMKLVNQSIAELERKFPSEPEAEKSVIITG